MTDGFGLFHVLIGQFLNYPVLHSHGSAITVAAYSSKPGNDKNLKDNAKGKHFSSKCRYFINQNEIALSLLFKN